jgi:hypothetical protein
MPRLCAVCAHPERQAIDRAIIAGEPKSAISRRWGLGPDAVERHAKIGHVVRNEQIIAAKNMLTPASGGDDIVEKLQELMKIVRGMMDSSIQNNQYLASLACARELVRIYELVAKLTGQLDESARVNIALVQQQQREAEQELMLERLTVPERLELRRLVTKAQGELPAPEMAVSVEPRNIVEANGNAATQSFARSD